MLDAIYAHADTLRQRVRFFQSNHEGEIIDELHRSRKWADAIIINPAAFTLAAPGQYGNAARNSLIGPNLIEIDASLFKIFPVGEKRRFEFRAEFFNLPNRANFAVPQHYVDGAQFGSITSTFNDPRDIQFSLRFAF